MKNIKYFLIFLALVIVAIIALNYLNSKPQKAKENPYAYTIDEFKEVDPSLIQYKEIRQLKVELDEHAALATFDGNIYLASNQKITTISPKGEKLSEFAIQKDVRALAVKANQIAVAYKQTVEEYTMDGISELTTPIISDSSVFTSIIFWNDQLMIADAGKRRISPCRIPENKAMQTGSLR